MGQILHKLQLNTAERVEENAIIPVKFPNLSELPPELSLAVLSHLDATDLCLASCVWNDLGTDEILWMRLCKNSWGSATVYDKVRFNPTLSYRHLYMVLDEATLTFNADPFEGEAYLIRNNVVDDCPRELGKFIHMAKNIRPEPRRIYLDKRRDVLDYVVQLQNFQNLFLPNALRKLFGEISAPKERGSYLEQILDKFSQRFCNCNPHLGLDKGTSEPGIVWERVKKGPVYYVAKKRDDAVFVLCYSLIMLSVDLTSPHVKNKMSKREFIKNTRRATDSVDEDLAGHLYDNIYLVGHVAAV